MRKFTNFVVDAVGMFGTGVAMLAAVFSGVLIFFIGIATLLVRICIPFAVLYLIYLAICHFGG